MSDFARAVRSHHPLPRWQAALHAHRIFQIPICACLANWTIHSAAWRYWRLNDSFCSERGSDGCGEDCRCFWMARTTPKIAPSPWNFVILPEEDRATAIGNMHRKTDKNCACGSGDMLADRQTHPDVLITILCNCSGRQSNNTHYARENCQNM